MSSFPVDISQTPALAEIVASLPLSLAPAVDAPQLAWFAGSSMWSARAKAAVDGGALAVVVSSPSAEGAGDGDPRVVLDWPFASNPGVLAAAEAAAPLRERAALAQASLAVDIGADFKTTLLDVITAASRVFGEFAQLETLHQDSAGWHLASRLAGGALLSLSIVVTNAIPTALRLRLLTDDGGLTVLVPSPDTAAPAEVRITGPDGEHLLPTLWETSRRASWRRAVAIANGDAARTGANCDDLAELRSSMSLAPTTASQFRHA